MPNREVHLRRVALTFSKIFRDVLVDFLYCPAPSRFGFLVKDGWWTHPDDRRFVVKEITKLAGYRLRRTQHWKRRLASCPHLHGWSVISCD
jgi:hypothetical protein